jgi:hypothetical protein
LRRCACTLQSPGGEFHGGTASSAPSRLHGHTCCSPPEGNFTEEPSAPRSAPTVARLQLQSPGGEFHGGTEFTFSGGKSESVLRVAVPRRGISRRNTSRSLRCCGRSIRLQSPGGEFHGGTERQLYLGQFEDHERCSPPEGNFTEERENRRRSGNGAPALQSPGGEFHGGTLHRRTGTKFAVPRRGISRRNRATNVNTWQSPGGEFHGGTIGSRRPACMLQSPGGEFHGGKRGAAHTGTLGPALQSPGGEFHGGTAEIDRGLPGRSRDARRIVAVPRRGISRRNGKLAESGAANSAVCAVAVPRRGISRRNPRRKFVAVPRRGISRRNGLELHRAAGRPWVKMHSCSPPEGNFTEERYGAELVACAEALLGDVAVPRRGISRRNPIPGRRPHQLLSSDTASRQGQAHRTAR